MIGQVRQNQAPTQEPFMPSTPQSPSSPGGKHLSKKSALAKARADLPKYADILIVEDDQLDADRLRGTLRSMFGYDVNVRRATTLGNALDCVIEKKPDIVFLDDHLKPKDNASETIPFLRRCNYEGPIIIVSGMLNQRRAAELVQAGAIVAIHKDNLDSSAIEEAILKVHAVHQKLLAKAS
jgi:DNA-binding NarL/FixJ family response regulator